MGRWWMALLVAALPAASPGLPSQHGSEPFGYTAKQLDCAQFRETADSKIFTQSEGREREQTSGRIGVWHFRATADGVDVALEGWLDSLSLWRRSAETTIRPDTDGLIGGRYRGILTRGGTYSARTLPFVPDEVAEVAGMATALDDFFPPVPPRLPQTGAAWSDSPGLSIRRLSDSALSGLPLYRFALEARRETRSAAVQQDTLQLRQVMQERGTFVWHPLLGLVGRERRIVIETTVPAGHSVRQTMRSRIEQRIRLLRDLSIPNSCPQTGQLLTPEGARRPDSGTGTR